MSATLTTTQTRGARVHVHLASETPTEASASKEHWHPFPWNYIPESVCGFLGLMLIVPVAPFMGVLIGSAELTWAILWRLHRALKLGFINKFVLSVAEKVGNVILQDRRNFSYLPYIFFLATWAPLLFGWALYVNETSGFQWSTFFIYHFLRIGPRFRFFAHQHVLLHKEGHERRIFKGPMRIFNYVCQWWVGPFYGQVPFSYGAAHNKIHHRFDNGLDDVHTNLDLDRSKPWSLVVYTPRFFLYWAGISPLAFFIKSKDVRLATQMGSGMLYYIFLIAVIARYDAIFCVAFFLFPFFESVLFFSAISYLWHAFVNPDDADNQFVNSLTILNGRDNIWNEDYHVVHHTAPLAHWTDYPKHYEDRIEDYKRSKASIFRDTEEGEMLVWMLTKRFDLLAKHFVDLSGTMTEEEKLALITVRLRATLSKASVAKAS